jgi:hypothetical protein
MAIVACVGSLGEKRSDELMGVSIGSLFCFRASIMVLSKPDTVRTRALRKSDRSLFNHVQLGIGTMSLTSTFPLHPFPSLHSSLRTSQLYVGAGFGRQPQRKDLGRTPIGDQEDDG